MWENTSSCESCKNDEFNRLMLHTSNQIFAYCICKKNEKFYIAFVATRRTYLFKFITLFIIWFILHWKYNDITMTIIYLYFRRIVYSKEIIAFLFLFPSYIDLFVAWYRYFIQRRKYSMKFLRRRIFRLLW